MQVIKMLLWITMSLIGVVVFILVAMPKSSKKENKFLIYYWAALFLHLFFVYLQEIGTLTVYQFGPIGIMFTMLYGPLTYFYLKAAIGSPPHRPAMELSLPIILFIVVFLIDKTVAFGINQIFYTMSYLLSLSIYFVLSLILVKGNSKEFVKNQNWIKIRMIFFLVFLLMTILEGVIIQINYHLLGNWYMVLRVGEIVLFCLVIIYHAINTPNIFMNVKIQQLRTGREYAEESDNGSELKMILQVVESNHLYFQPDFTRDTLVNYTGLSHQRVSELINRNFNTNFSDWTNSYRIKEAEKMLRNSNKSIKEIYYSVGFNSKSAFINAFKRKTGQTPSAYKNGSDV